MKKINFFLVIFALIGFLASCGGNSGNEQNGNKPAPESMIESEPEANPKGIGEVKSVNLTDPLEESMIASGKSIYEMK